MPTALSHIEGSTLAINGKAVLIGGLLTGGGGNMTSRVHVYMTDGFSSDESDRQVGFEGTTKFV